MSSAKRVKLDMADKKKVDIKSIKPTADIGLIGLAVMGENLILNLASKGFTVVCFNRTLEKVDKFISGRAKDKTIIGSHSMEEFIANLKKPRKVMIMVKAGKVVDIQIEKIVPFLEKGDIIIDGGNSAFQDTNRRTKELSEKGILYIGTGVSGGEEGALNGPSIMPGGSPEAWPAVKPILQKISAKVEDGSPCCEWVGSGGAGHYVKMVHNGIEYGDIQLICEAYFIMQKVLKLSNEEIKEVFEEWNKGDLDSYLIEITAIIMGHKEEDGTYTVDRIRDTAGQKGTGKWTVESALDMGMPVTLIGEAVFARCLSAQKKERIAASKVLVGPESEEFKGDKKQFLADLKDALLAAKMVSYAQGFVLIKTASEEYKWDIDFGSVALMWRGGCIIRSTFLGDIKKAFEKNPKLENLLLDDFFKSKITTAQKGWRRIICDGVMRGIPLPAMSSALAYYDGYRTPKLPANLLQAQRDFFGAHQYQLLKGEDGTWIHTDWTGRGGATASSTYSI